LASYNAGTGDRSPAEMVYYTGLLLAVGEIDQADEIIISVSKRPELNERTGRLASALADLIRIVQGRPRERVAASVLATELMVDSYDLQAHLRLDLALEAAMSALR